MSGIARGNGVDVVDSKTGAISSTNPDVYGKPVTTATNQCSSDVKCNNIGVVRMGDMVQGHLNISGGIDSSVITKANSKNVYANGKLIAVKGSQYTPDNTIETGSNDVKIG